MAIGSQGAIGVALVGYGLSGKVFHAPVISTVPDLSLRKVVTRQADLVAADWPRMETTTSFEGVLEDPEIDLVVIASPTPAHAWQTEAALEAGKHVVVEKPFTVKSADGSRLDALARSRRLVLSVFQNRRWDGDFRTVQRLVEDGTLGDISRFEAHFDRYRMTIPVRWRDADAPGGGYLYDLGAHLIDQVLVLFGPPETVWADLVIRRPGGRAVDDFHVVFSYHGLRAVVRSSMITAQVGPRYQIHGTAGSFLKWGLDPQEDALKAGGRPGARGWGQETPDKDGQLSVALGPEGPMEQSRVPTVAGNYATYYRAVAQSIRLGGPPPVTGAEGAAVIRAIELAMLSHREGRRVSWREAVTAE